MQQLAEELTSLNMIRSTPAFIETDASAGDFAKRKNSSVERQQIDSVVRLVRPIQRPVERILVRYSRVPTDVSNIIRLEDTNDEVEIREMIMHNAIAKYLSCR